MRISVVVPTCNRTELLRRCLTALCTQQFDRKQYEIIVADDAGSTETKRLVEQVGQNGVRCVYVPVIGKHGPAAARNAGIRVSRGEIIAFTDDDCIPRRDWLREGAGAFVDGVAGASGKVLVPMNGKKPTDYEVNAARLQFSEFVTASCFYRRHALLNIGGFDERFRMAWREDSDLFFTLMKRQHRLAYAPKAVVEHPVRPARWGVSIGQQKKNIFNALLYKKHPDLYRERLKPVIPWHYYVIVLALAAALSGMLTESGALTLSGLGAWSIGTALFCARRLRNSSHSPAHVAEMLLTSVVIPPTCIFWRIVGAIRYRVWFL
jgi:cellulose synthase/poly-beta-1,6-N-acetylglucosamine synthase-like glycosyltransferase